MIKDIITNINLLRKPCLPVEKGEDIKSLLQDLKDTCIAKNGWGCSANQIGVNKKVSYIRVPKAINTKTKEITYSEFYLINAKIIEKDRKYTVKGEGCLSFPGITVQTDRWIFITIQYLDENFKEHTALMQDYEALTIEHEIDHQNGLTIFDRKHKRK